MGKKINGLLLVAIIVIAADSVVLQFKERQSFQQLQQLYKKYDQLISTHKAYLSQYKREYSLLKIENRATAKLGMKPTKYRDEL